MKVTKSIFLVVLLIGLFIFLKLYIFLHRHTYLIPHGYQGTILVIYGVEDAPALKSKAKEIFFPINDNGYYLTSTEFKSGYCSNRYYYVDSLGHPVEEIPYTNFLDTVTEQKKIYVYEGYVGSCGGDGVHDWQHIKYTDFYVSCLKITDKVKGDPSYIDYYCDSIKGLTKKP